MEFTSHEVTTVNIFLAHHGLQNPFGTWPVWALTAMPCQVAAMLQGFSLHLPKLEIRLFSDFVLLKV